MQIANEILKDGGFQGGSVDGGALYWYADLDRIDTRHDSGYRTTVQDALTKAVKGTACTPCLDGPNGDDSYLSDTTISDAQKKASIDYLHDTWDKASAGVADTMRMTHNAIPMEDFLPEGSESIEEIAHKMKEDGDAKKNKLDAAKKQRTQEADAKAAEVEADEKITADLLMAAKQEKLAAEAAEATKVEAAERAVATAAAERAEQEQELLKSTARLAAEGMVDAMEEEAVPLPETPSKNMANMKKARAHPITPTPDQADLNDSPMLRPEAKKAKPRPPGGGSNLEQMLEENAQGSDTAADGAVADESAAATADTVADGENATVYAAETTNASGGNTATTGKPKEPFEGTKGIESYMKTKTPVIPAPDNDENEESMLSEYSGSSTIEDEIATDEGAAEDNVRAIKDAYGDEEAVKAKCAAQEASERSE
jgi:hypothetical protein